MSKKTERKVTKKSQPSTVTNFINQDNKSTKSTEDPDSSLKLFKYVKALPSTSSSSSSSSTNTSKAISTFINKPTTSPPKKISQKSSTTSRKKKSQVDIRKAWNKQEKAIHKAIAESCYDDGLDPDEVELALALSKSMQEQQQETSEPDGENSTKFDNPFQATKGNKIQPINSVLERFGFKTKKGLSDYEFEMMANNKKRSKYQKVPTLLTRTSKEQRDEMISKRVGAVLDDNERVADKNYDNLVTEFNVYSCYLQQFHVEFNSISALENSEESSDVLFYKYYITEIFEPSFTRADHLLKDWNKIPGRDRSPSNNRQTEILADEPLTEQSPFLSEQQQLQHQHQDSINSSVSDIFADVDSFEFGENCTVDASVKLQNVKEQLDTLQEKLSQQFEMENLSKTEDKSANESDHTIEYDFDNVTSKLQDLINLVSSDEEGSRCENVQKEEEEEIYDLTQCNLDNKNSSKSLENSSIGSEIIDISDDEVNYSIKMVYHENITPEKDDLEIIEIENIDIEEGDEEDGNKSIISLADYNVNITKSVSDLLQTSIAAATMETRRSNHSFNKFTDEGLSDSICNLINKYGKGIETPKRVFQKNPSESCLKERQYNLSQPSNIDLTMELENYDDIMTQSQENTPYIAESSINKSLANIMSSPMVVSAKKGATRKSRRRRRSLFNNEKYEIDTVSKVDEPDFNNMTPAELKKELFKYGIRPLAGKKAIELLQLIFNTLHPKIRSATDEEIDVNDTRLDFNLTDIVTDIVSKGVDDDFVFQYAELDGEDIILPKTKKSKYPSCQIPLQIAFYNMLRSNEKLQKFILEFRPLDLDLLHKHFRKFGLNYQLNDIISFLDRRCITFKTKDQSYSKTHERKKKLRSTKRSQKN